MIDRRLFVGGALALGLAGPALSKGRVSRSAAINALALPAGFNGLIAHGRGGRIEHVRLSGLADIEAKRPVSAGTAFRWGSASKWLASVAALRLAEQGRVRLDSPIIEYLPEFRRDTGTRITLRHLLSNCSGLPDLLAKRLTMEPELRTSTATGTEMIARFAGGDLVFAPGEGWDYAALNWVIVATILERAGGAGFPTLLQRLVFDPLRMNGAHLVQDGQPAMPSLAAAYDSAMPPRRKMAPVPPFLAASGNVAGTAQDAVRAAHGIFHGGVLRPASRKTLQAVHWPAEDYALGGRVRLIGGELWAWEAGKVGGYRALIAHRLRHSETVILFANGDQNQSLLSGWAEAVIAS